MKLLDSLLDAIVRLEGDALVMHVGEKPYVITTSAAMNAYRGPLAWGQVELSSRVLTFDAVSSMLAQILPPDQQRALDELGAIEHEILPPDGILDRFSVVVARGGEDVWVEVRRKPTPAASVDVPAPAAIVVEQSTVYAPEMPVAVPESMQAASEPDVTPVAEPASPLTPPPVEATVVIAPAVVEQPVVEPAVVEPPELATVAEPSPVVEFTTAEEVPSVAIAAEPDEVAPEAQEESIVVALPGEEYQEVALGGVSDHAIQIIEDEAQGVPTEEEVDAMLAATASALLSSGLAVDADTLLDAEARIQPAAELEGSPESIEIALTQELVESALEQDAIDLPLTLRVEQPVAIEQPIELEQPIEIDLVQSASVITAPEPEPEVVPEFTAADNVPEFALSPPPQVVPEAEATESIETPVEAPQGAPLFSDEAIAAAAAPEPAVAAPEPAVVVVPEAPAPTEAASREAAPAELEAGIAAAPEPLAIEPEGPAAIEVVAPVVAIEPEAPPAIAVEPPAVAIEPEPQPVASEPQPVEVATTEWASQPSALEPTPASEPPSQTPEIPMEFTHEQRHEEVVTAKHAASAAAQYDSAPPHDAADEARTAVVVPLARNPIKPESIAVPYTPGEDAALMRTLRLAAARGAATVYVVAQSKPMLRIDGEIAPLESEPVLTAADVDRLVMELVPPRRRDALQNGPVEWLCDIPEVGRVRCLTFRDHRGPGVLFRMFPQRAISADQLALTPEVQALCQQSDGLVLVTGARSSGKSTLLNAFVDQINKTRSDHVITIESQIGFVHESRKSFISQRETRGDGELAAALTRAALREDPDVMMIEELKSADLVSAALEAAESGRLVLASVPAASTIAALERVIELLPADRRARGRAALATSLRGVLAQILLRRVTGGRVAAREILLNTPAVSTLVLEGKMFQLPVALDSGRRHGMVPLTDSLAQHVREGTVNPGEAYRKALDRAALVAALKRDGVDTSFAERLA